MAKKTGGKKSGRIDLLGVGESGARLLERLSTLENGKDCSFMAADRNRERLCASFASDRFLLGPATGSESAESPEGKVPLSPTAENVALLLGEGKHTVFLFISLDSLEERQDAAALGALFRDAGAAVFLCGTTSRENGCLPGDFREFEHLRAAVDGFLVFSAAEGGLTPGESCVKTVSSLLMALTGASRMNLTPGDLKDILGAGDFAVVGYGEANEAQKVKKAVKRAIASSSLSSLKKAASALLVLHASPSMSILEAAEALSAIQRLAYEEMPVEMGVIRSEEQDETVRIVLIVTRDWPIAALDMDGE